MRVPAVWPVRQELLRTPCLSSARVCCWRQSGYPPPVIQPRAVTRGMGDRAVSRAATDNALADDKGRPERPAAAGPSGLNKSRPEKPAAEGPSAHHAADMLAFINKAWTQYHAVEEASRVLRGAGFVRLSERESWDLQPSGRYFFTRNSSTLVAFAVGGRYQPGAGVHMIGAHTDSPCLKLKPVSKGKKSGFQMVNVETYGGGLWATWFDRDLSVAGRVFVRRGDRIAQQLVKIERPILRIPMLAIHLNRDIGEKGFNPNKQTHLAPILATALRAAANRGAAPEGPPAPAAGGAAERAADGESSRTGESGKTSDAAVKLPKTATAGEKHHSALLRALGAEVGCAPDDILDLELNVCDTQPGVIAGLHEEFVCVGRLDNLAMSWAALRALVDTSASAAALSEAGAIRAVALFDHEEVGSASAQGAGGPVMRDAITRVTTELAGGRPEAVMRALQSSFLVSADMAHALHPNYADKHEPDHAPAFHAGLVIKHNSNQRYATNALSATLFREVARRQGIPTQEFCVRSDMACGSTIGPILASGLGCRTVDVGIPQLAMHSIREMCAVDDVAHARAHFSAFFRDFEALDAALDAEALPEPDIRGDIPDTPCEHTATHNHGSGEGSEGPAAGTTEQPQQQRQQEQQQQVFEKE